MFHLDTLSTLVAATLVLLLGRKLVQTVPFLKKYTIPEPVAGGLLVALALLALKKSMDIEIDFDMSLKDPLMLAFFATIGLNANLASLRAGGKVLGTFLIVVVGLLLLQNALGIGMATLLGLDPLMGLLAGSITLSGGHGTGAAWSKLFVERYGFANATEVAMACATFGLVLGGLIGGPVARYLVKHSSSPDGTPDDQVAPTAFEKPDVGRVITSLVLIESIALIAICLTLGKVVAQLLAGSVFELPTFVCVLFIGVILSNSLALAGLYRVFDRAVSVLGNVSLSLFLAMALMSLKLWELASLALPRNSDRLTLPSTDTARSNTRYNPASARLLLRITPINSTQTKVGSSKTLPASSCATTLPTVRQIAIRAILSISTSEVITRPTSGFSKAVGAT
jgi:ESS family glutamate:Na+ symporter